MSDEEPRRAIVHLIDDDLAVRESTEVLLQSAGIDVRTYASAIDFLNEVNPKDIRFLIVDVNMPGINGIELLDRLRSAGITAPAVFTTGRGDTADLREAAARTGAGVLLKPYKFGELKDRIKRALYES